MNPDMQKKFEQVQARLEAKKAPPAKAPDDVPDGVPIDAEFTESDRIEEAEEADLLGGRTIEELLKDGTAVAACSTGPPITLESCREAMQQLLSLKKKDDAFEILKAETLRGEFLDWVTDLPDRPDGDEALRQQRVLLYGDPMPVVKVPGRVLVNLDALDPWRLLEEKVAYFLERAARGYSPEVYEAKRDILLKLLPVPLHPYADERLRQDLDLVSRELPHMLLELRQVSLGRNQLVSDEGWAELAHCYVAVAARVIRERLAPTYEHQLSEQDLAAVLREMVPHVLDESGLRIALAERKEGWRRARQEILSFWNAWYQVSSGMVAKYKNWSEASDAVQAFFPQGGAVLRRDQWELRWDLVAKHLFMRLEDLRALALKRNLSIGHCRQVYFEALATYLIDQMRCHTWDSYDQVPEFMLGLIERAGGQVQREEKVRVHPDPRDTDQLTARLLATYLIDQMRCHTWDSYDQVPEFMLGLIERAGGQVQREEKVRVHPDPRDTDQLTARLLKTVASRGVSRARRELAADRLARRLDRAPTDRLETGLAHLEDLAFQLTMLQESAGLPDHLVIHSLHMMEAWLLDAFRNLATLSFREFYETVHKQAAQVLARAREVADGQTKANRSGAAGPVWHAGGPAVDDSVYAVCPGDQATPEQLTEEAKHAWQLRHERAVQEALAERRSRERGPASGPPADAQPGGDLADQASRLRDGGTERPWSDQL